MLKYILLLSILFSSLLYSSQTYTDEFMTVEIEETFASDFIKEAIKDIDISEIESMSNHFELLSPMSKFYLYNGDQTSSSLDFNTWKRNYRQYYLSAVDSENRIPTFDTLIEKANEISNDSKNPILIFAADYESFSKEAWDDGTIKLINGKYVINDSSDTEIFTTKQLIQISAFNNVIIKGNQEFVFNFNDLSFNSHKEIDYIQVDLDDGSGTRVVYSDTSLLADYLIDGVKELTFKVTFSDQTQLYSKSILSVQGAEYDTPTPSKLDMENYYRESRNYWSDEIYSIRSFNGEQRKLATGYVYLGCGNEILDKPLMIIEGFDPTDLIKATDVVIPLADSKYDISTGECIREEISPGIIRRLENNTLDNNGEGLFKKLIKEGYDVVVINFNMKEINKYHNKVIKKEVGVEDLANYFNEIYYSMLRKKSGMQKTKVMGISMGGLVGRIAIKKLEDNPTFIHDISHFISVDAPHRGAYINLATQSLLHHYHGGFFTEGSVKNVWNKLSNRLAKQMLIMYASNTDRYRFGEFSSENWSDDEQEIDVIVNERSMLNNAIINHRKEFVEKLETIGYPERTTNITLTNGSITNKDQEIDTDVNLLGGKVSGFYEEYNGIGARLVNENYVRSLPDNDQVNKQILNSNLYLHGLGTKLMNVKVNVKNEDQNMDLVLENVSGGHATIVGGVYQEMANYLYCEKNKGGSIEYFQPSSNFIPTASSIDIRNPDNSLDNFYQYFDVNFKEELISGNVITPFDQVYATDENTDHALAEQTWGNKLTAEKVGNKRAKLLGMIDDLFEHTFENIYIQNKTISTLDDYLTNNFIRVGRDVIKGDYFIDHSNSKGNAVFNETSNVLMEAAENIIFKHGSRVRFKGKLHARLKPKKFLACDVFLPKQVLGFESNEEIQLNIYPNPSSNEIKITALEGVYYQIVIYDQAGNKVLSKSLNDSNELNFDISFLPTGPYFIKLISKDSVQTGKFIKVD